MEYTNEIYTVPAPFRTNGYLWVKACDNKFYWAVGRVEPKLWEEISMELYQALLIHKEDYSK